MRSHTATLGLLQSDQRTQITENVSAVLAAKLAALATVYPPDSERRRRPRFISHTELPITRTARISQNNVSGHVIDAEPFNHHI
jgi:hypothetical protein